MLTVALIVELSFVIGFPLALGWWFRRRWRVSWLLFAAGALTFGVSQAVHLPLNQAIFALAPAPLPQWANALILGFTAGLCEETARYVAYRWVLRDLKSWREALMFGAGHGGIESIVIVGLLVGAIFLNMTVLQGSALEGWSLPGGQVAQLQGQLDLYWGQSWTGPLLAAAERLSAIIFHLGMAVLVLQAVSRQRPAYWLLAIGLHTALNAVALLTVQAGWSSVATEGVIALFALLALGLILQFRDGREGAVVEEVDSLPRRPTLPPLPAVPKRPPTAEERLRQQIQESKWE
jgi:uncharacterized membrane protein YhfC